MQPATIDRPVEDRAETRAVARTPRSIDPRTVVRGVALAAAVAAAFADGDATGLGWWDALLQAAVAGLFVLGSRRLPSWFVIVAATVATVVAGDSWWLLAAMASLGLAIGVGALPTRSTLIRTTLKAVAAALIAQALLRIPPIGFFGLPSLIAGAVLVVAAFLWYSNTSRLARRSARWAAALLAILVVDIAAVGGVAMLRARDDIDRGIDAARAGLSAARGGDPEEVVARLETAAEALESAESMVSGVFGQPLRLLPVAAQHHRAITVATGQGSQIARQASRTTVEADISSISLTAGSLDLASLSAMQDDLAETVSHLETGVVELDAVQSPWLVSLVSDRLGELTQELRDVLPEARVAADAARIVPGLLGQDEPRRYFVAFGSPAESREFGGFVGSWAVLEVDGGAVRQAEFGRTQDLYDLTRSQEPLATDRYPLWYIERARPRTWPQNITGTTELATIAAAARDLLSPLGGGDIDGVVYLDPYALGAILQLTGPVRIEGVDGPINGGNAADFLLNRQFGLENREQLKSEMSDLFSQAFQDLLESELPGPERLGLALGPVARQGRLQVATFDEAENLFLQSVKLQRVFEFPDDAIDGFAVVQTNAMQNKLDTYLQRNISYDVTVEDTGALTGTATIELTSAVPDDAAAYALGDVDPGISRLYLSLFTPHLVTEVRVEGVPVDAAFTAEYGYGRVEALVETPPGETRTVEFDIVGRVDPAVDYSVQVWYQPLVNNDTVSVGHEYDGQTTAVDPFELTETTVVRPG